MCVYIYRYTYAPGYQAEEPPGRPGAGKRVVCFFKGQEGGSMKQKVGMFQVQLVDYLVVSTLHFCQFAPENLENDPYLCYF